MNVPRLLATAALLSLGGSVGAQRVMLRQQSVIRIPLQPMTALPMPPPPTQWKEVRGPKCIVRADIIAASVNGLESVDFILADRTRHRAKLQNRCMALDYYSGFYLQPTADGKICQDRDSIHARSGGECQIDSFRKLTPARAR